METNLNVGFTSGVTVCKVDLVMCSLSQSRHESACFRAGNYHLHLGPRIPLKKQLTREHGDHLCQLMAEYGGLLARCMTFADDGLTQILSMSTNNGDDVEMPLIKFRLRSRHGAFLSEDWLFGTTSLAAFSIR